MKPAGRRILLCLLFALVLASTEGAASDFYVRTLGDDGAAGTSPATAWQTIERVSQHDLEPGDRVLFAGGETFAGTIVLDEADAGTPVQPVVLTSFGDGRATLDAGDGDGIQLGNCGGVEIRELAVIGSGPETNTGVGVRLHTDDPTGAKFEHVRIDRVDVSGFRKGGIVVESTHESLPGFRDVEITHCRVFGNGETGIGVSGTFRVLRAARSHEDIYIAHCEVYDNLGDPTDLTSHTGSGIIVSATDGAVIEFCHAHHNGGINSQNSGGPVGIWAWQSNDVVMQFNISHHNRTGGGADGGGFDLDGGITNSVMQYNYSYQNDGAGYLLAQFSSAPAFRDNVVRYNVSHDDGRRNSYGGIVLFTDFLYRMTNIEIYGNTVYMSPAEQGAPRPFRAFSGTYVGVHVRNNIFLAAAGVQLVHSSPNLSPESMAFQGNAYWSAGGGFDVAIGAASFDTLADWRSSGQEMVDAKPSGLHADPRLVDAADPPLLTDPTLLGGLDAFRVRPGSPVIDAGLDLAALFGLEPGPRDFYGAPLPQGEGFEIGAAEYVPEPSRDVSVVAALCLLALWGRKARLLPATIRASLADVSLG